MKNDTYKFLTIHTDGGSRGNPGHAGIGYVFSDGENGIIDSGKKYIGIATNNEAEYQGLLDALKHLKLSYPSCLSIAIFCDSELMVKQVKGEYKIRKPHLLRFVTAIREELSTLDSWELSHVRREFNKDADAKVNEALDEKGY